MTPSKRVSLVFLLAFAVVAGASLQPSAAARDAPAAKADQDSSMPQPSAGGWLFPSLPSFPCIPGLPQLPWLPSCNNATNGGSSPLPSFPSFPCIPGLPQLPWLPPCNNATNGGSSPLPSFPSFRCIPGLPRLPWLPPCNNATNGGSSPLPSFPSFRCIPGLPRLPWLPPCNNATNGGSSPPAPPQPAECGTPLAGMMPCADFLTNTSVTAPPAACCDGFKAVVKDAPVCMCHVVNRDFSKLLPAPMLRLRMMMLPRVCGAAMPFGTLRQCIRGPVPPMNPPSMASP